MAQGLNKVIKINVVPCPNGDGESPGVTFHHQDPQRRNPTDRRRNNVSKKEEA
jgi:hypothetical protein